MKRAPPCRWSRSISALSSAGSIPPAAGTPTGGGREFPTLAPELLLYDDALVKVDTDNRANYLRVDYRSGSRYVDISRYGTPSTVPPFNYVRDPVADAPGPLPLPLPLTEGRNQQFWVTVHAPSNAAPGTYTTEITLTADGAAAGSLQLSATVRPYLLPRPMTRYNPNLEYLGAFMNHCQLASQVGMGKSLAHAEKRFLAEMRNMVAHNMLHPFMSGFDNESDDELTIRQFQLMREAGMPLRPLFGGSGFNPEWLGWMREGGSFENEPETYERLRRDFEKRIIRAAGRFDEVVGHRDVYFYGLDEAGPGTVRQEFAFFSILHKYGVKAFITSGVPPLPTSSWMPTTSPRTSASSRPGAGTSAARGSSATPVPSPAPKTPRSGAAPRACGCTWPTTTALPSMSGTRATISGTTLSPPAATRTSTSSIPPTTA